MNYEINIDGIRFETETYIPVVTKTEHKNLLKQHMKVLRNQKQFKQSTERYLDEVKFYLYKGKTEVVYEMLEYIEQTMNKYLKD